jgi:DNA-binding transcriptional ArsR family regulator
MLDALGDSTRRAIFERLAAGALSVGEIHRGLPVSRPAVSQHLKVLKHAGLVIDRGEGTRRYYQANPTALQALHAYLDRFWDRALAAFKEAAEAEARRATGPGADHGEKGTKTEKSEKTAKPEKPEKHEKGRRR